MKLSPEYFWPVVISVAAFLIILFALPALGIAGKPKTNCNIYSLHNVSWTVNGCTCVADTLSAPPLTAYAKDTSGATKGQIDRRDLICDEVSNKWRVKSAPRYATCSGCGSEKRAMCGAATQQASQAEPKSHLCLRGLPSPVRKGYAWTWSCHDPVDDDIFVECRAFIFAP
ncbi:MAG: hypothetical protein HC788_00870 [Sphingopyxis sp.]|nr:hypothetical protein [Sphingopyxis sp.]